MYTLKITSAFKKDLKTLLKQGKDLNKLNSVVNKLAAGEELSEKYRDHKLSGNYDDFHECHIEPDWLLIYLLEESVLTLTLTRTGRHSDLFR